MTLLNFHISPMKQVKCICNFMEKKIDRMESKMTHHDQKITKATAQNKRQKDLVLTN